jgi:hypothetical protein
VKDRVRLSRVDHADLALLVPLLRALASREGATMVVSAPRWRERYEARDWVAYMETLEGVAIGGEARGIRDVIPFHVRVERGLTGEFEGFWLHEGDDRLRHATLGDSGDLLIWIGDARERLVRAEAQRQKALKLTALKVRSLEARVGQTAEALGVASEVSTAKAAARTAHVVLRLGPTHVHVTMPIEGDELEAWLAELPGLIGLLRRIGPNARMTVRPEEEART